MKILSVVGGLALIAMIIVLFLASVLEARDKKMVWVYDCFLTMSGAVSKLNTLGPEQAEMTKFVGFDHATLSYCLVFPNGQ